MRCVWGRGGGDRVRLAGACVGVDTLGAVCCEWAGDGMGRWGNTSTQTGRYIGPAEDRSCRLVVLEGTA